MSYWPKPGVYVNMWSGRRWACVVLGEVATRGHLCYRVKLSDGTVLVAEKEFVDIGWENIMTSATIRFPNGQQWTYANCGGNLYVSTGREGPNKQLALGIPRGLNAAEFGKWIAKQVGGTVIAVR